MKIHNVNMSSSTIFIKKPLNYQQSLARIKEKYREYVPVLSFLLWTISGIYSASQSTFNYNLTGVTLAFPVSQIVTMFVSSILLCKGLSDKKTLLLIPWIGVTMYTLYYNHYLGLLQTLGALKHVKKLSWLPWINLSVNILLLIVRATLVIRIFQYCVHLWVKNKLKEMKRKL